MKKRVLSLFLALCLFGGNCLTAFAETAYQEGAADDLALEPQGQPQNGNEIPVLTQDSIAIDLEHQYPGMDKTYGAGYSGTVAERKLRLVLPLLNHTYRRNVKCRFPDSRGKAGIHYLSEYGSRKWTSGRKRLFGRL